MEPYLQLRPEQERLTEAQQAEAERFAEAYIQAQLSTEPVDEQEAEALLRQAYQAAKLPPPERIQWVDGPLQLVAVVAPHSVRDSVRDSVQASVRDRVQASVRDSIRESVWDSVQASIGDSVQASVSDSVGDSVQDSIGDTVSDRVGAYYSAFWLAVYHFFDVYLAPNDLHALACFNQMVSGYWLGQDKAVIVRHPTVLSRDDQGRLHSASGRAIEYHDGWGFYAWHGVQVPEQVIVDPDGLTREEFLSEPNVEVRRVMQERMGQRFVSAVGGEVIDTGPRGTLYEVRLPEDDPEGVARYLQVRDASTPRQYFLRVPPSTQTAAEAVAWSFGLPVQDYGPAQET